MRGTDCMGSCLSNYYAITTTIVPNNINGSKRVSRIEGKLIRSAGDNKSACYDFLSKMGHVRCEFDSNIKTNRIKHW